MNRETKLKIDPQKLIKHDNKEFNFKDLVNHFLTSYQSINHEVYRKVIKKVIRKYYRQQNSIFLNNFEKNYPRIESRPIEFNEHNTNDEKQDEFKNVKEHKLWLERERLAQIEWKAKKEREDRHLKKQKQQETEEIVKKNLNQIDHNPIINIPLIEDQREKCIYFIKTGVCKYGNLCTKSHRIDSDIHSFTTLIFPGMYTNMLLGYEMLKLNNDSDEALEYEESDILEHFKNFYDDVLDEFKSYGRIVQFLVCSNCQFHLRGNVYVQFEKEKDALNAYKGLNGRYYASKQIFCYFSHVKNWKQAVCGLFLQNKCDKGRKCNYMHVFQNPYNEFKIENFEHRSKSNQQNDKYSFRNCNNNFNFKWSSDEEETIKENINKESNNRRNKSKHKRKISHHEKSRSRSISPKHRYYKQKHSHKRRSRRDY